MYYDDVVLKVDGYHMYSSSILETYILAGSRWNLQAMTEKSPKAGFAYHVFRKNYSTLRESLGSILVVAASHLYSSGLISQGIKDLVTLDVSTPTVDRPSAVLNDVEGRLKSNEQVFEAFLKVLRCEQIGLGHIADPMSFQYQQLCEGSNYSNLVVSKESSCFVAPGLSHVRGVEVIDPFLGGAEKTQEQRPNHLPFTNPGGRGTLSDIRSLVPFEKVETRTPQSELIAQRREEVSKSLWLYFESVEEAKRQECEKQVESLKKSYELKCDRLEAEIDETNRTHKDEVDALMKSMNTYARINSEQEERIHELEEELDSVSKDYTTVNEEVEKLRQTLADRETKLDRVRSLMESKQQELRQLKGEPTDSPTAKHKAKLQVFKRQISHCEEIQGILVQLRNCPPNDIDSLKHDLKEKIEEFMIVKKERSMTV